MRVARLFLFIFASLAAAETPQFRMERVAMPGGAELITIFGMAPQNTEIPLISVLRDTLGEENPDHDRLRYVWVLTSSRPTMLERAAGALPFFYWRAQNSRAGDEKPVPVLDLGAPARPVVSSLAGSITQLLAFDPDGALIRSSTRSYRNNLDDHRLLHLLEGLAVVSQLEDDPQAKEYFTSEELTEIETRLMLAGHSLGGLVSSSHLAAAYMKQRARMEETRGHNWELLRQRAELDGLYFEPFGADGSSTHALLWIATEDLGSGHKWDGQFLGISDPYRDPRLKNWAGYREVREGKEMIPLAMYSFDYPKVPLMVVDFRDSHRAKQREMISHAATDTVSGILGISRFTNMPFLFGSIAFNFVRTRHGAASNRNARLQAYAEIREWMELDRTVDPALRRALQKRLEIMGVNPMEESMAGEAKMAQRQYAALLRYAQDPAGLPAKVERDREAELYADNHGLRARFGFALSHAVTLGIYRHPEEQTELVEARLDEERRIAHETRFLETVARSSPRPEIVWNMDEVRRALDDVANAKLPPKSAKLVREIMLQTQDEATRVLCARALEGWQIASMAGGLQ